ncbi:DEAD/DEAH box helicase [Candidatus Venteria ishoeyi]|uniref:ATP-dependent RNA helicase DeaD n=1 Tax=Candidatus Venteria ishoeyi TaxID=1899563 RepID=A0A1H6FBN4_9GAMM|nr:DEAD/DEAH box helicase [Candidatus Venteria ishoeyi]MDM8545516.1 DEAD/DEAH box helicase [Candidatus Venteria ishoeyi]SEH07053.1 ATP-dependent RNA helicase DeaD [Candidatus Venteria ishoeyi]
MTTQFQALNLSPSILQALEAVGYETPSPIQEATIPPLLEGRDVLGQAQTGTGKTAAFALPVLSSIQLDDLTPQVLVLTPTRELAIQVAEAFQRYAHYMSGFHVLPIYGGQSYENQLRQLRRGVHVVVGTPGRVMDHIRRGTLQLNGLKTLVLDEADEMLRMGFIDDVEWILEQIPETRQIALFSATMPSVIRKVAKQYLHDPVEIKIAAKTTTATNIRQRYWQVSGLHKLDALTRLLEVEEFDAILIFVRTKTATLELAEKLAARGYACAALNGDIDQKQRERTVDKLKNGQLDIIIATDVAARGLDVQRVSHVINYDIPSDVESYVHRVGRTGRAGRSGDAILFVAPRERRLLYAIERNTRHKIEQMQMPTASTINEQRVSRFKQRINDVLTNQNLDVFSRLVTEYEQEFEVDPLQMAAALAYMTQGKEPLFLSDKPQKKRRERHQDEDRGDRGDRSYREKKDFQRSPKTWVKGAEKPKPLKNFPDIEMERFKLAVGYNDEVKPGNIVGAIANEAGVESQYIGHIEIYEDFSTIDLPAEITDELLQELKKTRICGQRIDIKRAADADQDAGSYKKSRSDGKPRSQSKSRKPKPHRKGNRGEQDAAKSKDSTRSKSGKKHKKRIGKRKP